MSLLLNVSALLIFTTASAVNQAAQMRAFRIRFVCSTSIWFIARSDYSPLTQEDRVTRGTANITCRFVCCSSRVDLCGSSPLARLPGGHPISRQSIKSYLHFQLIRTAVAALHKLWLGKHAHILKSGRKKGILAAVFFFFSFSFPVGASPASV